MTTMLNKAERAVIDAMYGQPFSAGNVVLAVLHAIREPSEEAVASFHRARDIRSGLTAFVDHIIAEQEA